MFLVVENVIQLKDPRFMDVVGVIWREEEEEDEEEDEEDDEEEDEEDEEEEMGELTLTMLGLLPIIGSSPTSGVVPLHHHVVYWGRTVTLAEVADGCSERG